VHPGFLCAAALSVLATAHGQVLFSDNFTNGASTQWGNEVGNWTSASGVYYSSAPNNAPPTYTSLPYALTDFAFTVTINQISDGGIWLRSADNQNGVLLVTGGNTRTGTGFYWHIVQGGSYGGSLNGVSGLFTNGESSGTVTVVVSGDTYSAYFNGQTTPVTTLTTNAFTSGKVGLYSFSSQSFDNVVLSAVPEPQTIALLAVGAMVLALGAARPGGHRTTEKPPA
jgi:hypothetical protein